MIRFIQLFFVLVILWCSPAAGQSLPTEPNRLRDEIKAGTVQPEIARELNLSCADRKLESVVSDVELRKGSRYSIVQAFETMCDKRTIIVLRSVGNEWQYVQSLLLSTPAGVQPSITFKDLLGTGEEEIIVNGELVDHGTGIEQKNTTIFKLIREHVETVFDAPESIHIEEPGPTKLYSFRQASVFRFVPNPDSNGKEQMIDEKQTLMQQGKMIIRLRACTWSVDLERFRCYERAPWKRHSLTHESVCSVLPDRYH
jgi:hypothetical protein